MEQRLRATLSHDQAFRSPFFLADRRLHFSRARDRRRRLAVASDNALSASCRLRIRALVAAARNMARDASSIRALDLKLARAWRDQQAGENHSYDRHRADAYN